MSTCGVCGTGVVKEASSWMCEDCDQELVKANKRKDARIMKRYAPWAGSMDENEAGLWVKREEVRELEAENERLREVLRYVCLGLCDHEYHKRVGLCDDCRVHDALKGGEE